MTTKVTGFIIGKKDFREADRLFTIYTKEMGKIDAMAQGCRKLSSKLSGNLELLHHAVFTIAKGKQIDRIATVDVIETYEDIKKNFDSLTAALYACDLCDRVVKPGVYDAVIYDLFDELFSLCTQTQGRSAALAHLFIIKLAEHLGTQPTAKGFEKALSELAIEETLMNLEKLSRASLASLLDRPSPSQVFFDFLTQRQPTSSRVRA